MSDEVFTYFYLLSQYLRVIQINEPEKDGNYLSFHYSLAGPNVNELCSWFSSFPLKWNDKRVEEQ